jgi:hypothetical protein
MGGIDLKTKAVMAAWMCGDKQHEQAGKKVAAPRSKD